MLYVVCVCTCVREMHYIKAPHPVEYTTKTCLAIHWLENIVLAFLMFACWILFISRRGRKNTNNVSFFADKFHNIHKTFSILWVCYIMLYSLFNVFLFVVQTFTQFSFPGTSNAHTYIEIKEDFVQKFVGNRKIDKIWIEWKGRTVKVYVANTVPPQHDLSFRRFSVVCEI